MIDLRTTDRDKTRNTTKELLAHAAAVAVRMAFPIPTDPDLLLNRKDIAAALTAAGYRVTESTLATKASRGGGPMFRRFGSRPLYRWSDALAWARGRLGPPLRNTSEGKVDASKGVRQDRHPLHVPAE
jgi:hypothetical protein